MKFSQFNKHNPYKVIRAFLKELIYSSGLVIFIAIYPTVAHAGFFSIFSSLGPDQVSAQVSPINDENSQTMDLLKASNNIDPHATLADDVLPVSGNALSPEVGPSGTIADVDSPINTQISTYTVRDGDTLSSVANIYGVSVNTILWANDIEKGSKLRAGQSLVILPMSGVRYIVKNGDTLQGIAKTYGANITEILQYNDITIDSHLVTGQTILIPDVEALSAVDISTTKKPATRKAGYGYGAPGSNPAHDTDGPSYPGYYGLPIDHGTETQGLHGYNAVDLAAPKGTPVHASADGVVIISVSNGAWNGGYGNYIVTSYPNGTQTLVGHLSRNLVTVGQKVTRGQTVGLLGATGEATGPHVHFEIRGAHNPFGNLTTF